MSLNIEEINSNWTLFLDRDGVINVEKKEDYIKKWDEFQFYENTLEALALLAKKFKTIVITTNQKGIGKGLMTHEDLSHIHQLMLKEIESNSGRIDHIFYCADLDDKSPNRKPQPGMALQAQKLFPNIKFDQSIIVGNRMSDMQFGRNAGLHTVFVATTHPDTPFPDPHIDLRFDNLLAFAKSLI